MKSFHPHTISNGPIVICSYVYTSIWVYLSDSKKQTSHNWVNVWEIKTRETCGTEYIINGNIHSTLCFRCYRAFFFLLFFFCENFYSCVVSILSYSSFNSLASMMMLLFIYTSRPNSSTFLMPISITFTRLAHCSWCFV